MTGHDTPERVYIGCAGWNFARTEIADPPADGTQLQRYASLFRAVEITSSFHRSHRRGTYERWAAGVPDSFRFSVKLPKTITHANRLADANRLLQRLSITRVAADPAVVPAAAEPGGDPGKVYLRLHGSPQVYYSPYTQAYLDGLAFRLRAYARAGAGVWCIFDNTIRGAATSNALHVMRKIVLEEAALSTR